MTKDTVTVYTYDELSERGKETANIELNMLFGGSYFKTEEARLEQLRKTDYRSNGFSHKTDEDIERVRLENERHGN